MEVIDYQEFAAQDSLTVNSQSIFNVDTTIVPESTIGDRIGGDRFNSHDAVFLSEQRLEAFQNNGAETMQSFADVFTSQQNTDTSDVFSSASTKYLQLGNEEINYGDDVLMSGGEALESNPSLQATQQADSLAPENSSLLENSGFSESLNGTNWLIGKTGKVREYDQNVEPVAYIQNVAGRGRQMYLKLPQEAKINYEDQLSIFQDVSNLKTDKVYAVEAQVKWLNPENDLPSAIVSFWAKNPDNSFRGKDFAITDGNGYKTIRFEFTPSQMGTTRFFLGLFTHVNGNIDDTEIYVDNYKVTEIGDVPSGLDTRKGNLLRDGGFDNYTPGAKSFNPNGWTYTVESPVPGLTQSIQTVNQNELLRLEFPKAKNSKDENNTSVTGVYQNVNLIGGQTYEISADFRRRELDRFGSRQNSLVQLITYRKQKNGEELFLGPIDVELTNNNLVSKNFTIVAPESGQYTTLVRLAGWGNEGNGIVVDVDNVSLVAK